MELPRVHPLLASRSRSILLALAMLASFASCSQSTSPSPHWNYAQWLDSYAAPGQVALHWYLSTNPPRDDDIGPYEPSPRVAQVAVLRSTAGPEEGYERVLMRASEGLDSALVTGLTDGRVYWFKLAAFDLMGRLILATDPVMTVPGPLTVPAQTIPLVMSGRFSWSADGDTILFAEGGTFAGNTISALSLTSLTVTQSSTGGLIRDAEVSPDGSLMAYTKTPSTTSGVIDYRIWILNRDTQTSSSVSPGRVDADASWGDPGTLYFCRGTYDPPNIPEIWRLDLNSPSGMRQVTWDQTIYKYQTSVRRSDELIVYSGYQRSSRFLRYGLYLVRPESGASRALARFRWHSDTYPFWASDGNHVVFVSDRSGHPEVWSTDVRTGRVSQLTRSSRGRRVKIARWSPDMSRLAVLEGDGWVGHPAHLEIYSGLGPLPYAKSALDRVN